MAGIQKVTAESRRDWCDRENKETEFRRYRRGKKANGDPIYQWRCRSCLNKSDRRAKSRLHLDIAVSQGKKSVNETPFSSEVDRDILEGWNVWVEWTERPDRDSPNSRYVEAYSSTRDYFTKDQMQDSIKLASYLEPRDRDPLDVRRLVDVLTTYWAENEAQEEKDNGGDIHISHLAPSVVKEAG